MPLAAGARLGLYEIVGLLGAGGMGEVYRARDTRLKRDIALKVLPDSVAGDPDRLARFQREAELLASVNHPNIVTIHSVERASGIDFLTMEFVEGPTLEDRIGAGSMPVAEAVGVARQLADALVAAHARGIVHRDLKPANVKVTADGKVKVLDFGLAKSGLLAAAGDAEQATLTRSPTIAGTVTGTPSYMSPEQARGQPVDVRADVWAFGCVLYEMLAGERPFHGRTITDVLAAVIKDEPRWGALPASTPPALCDLVRRCLEKDAGLRLAGMAGVPGLLAESMADETGARAMPATKATGWVATSHLAGRRRVTRLAAAAAIVMAFALAGIGLRTLLTRSRPGGQARSIAVLPLGNVSGNPDDQYFADGMTDVLIGNLGSIETLRVTSRTSVMAYRGSARPPRDVARELKVDAIVEGSAMRSGDRVMISARLIDAAGGTIIWSVTRERDIRDVMVLQGELARDIARRLQTTVAPDVERRLAATAVRPDVYEDLLKGRYFAYQSSPEGLAKGEELFNRALQKEPTLALAHAGLATIFIQRNFMGLLPSSEALEKAKMHAVRAVQLDDQLSDAHASLGWISFQNWDWVTTEKEFRRAIELNASNAEARVNYAHFLSALSRNDEALGEGRRAREVDPLSLPIQTAYAAVLIGAGRYDEAITLCKETLRMNPAFPWAHHHLWRAYTIRGRFDEALAEARTLYSALGDTELVNAFERGMGQAGYAGAMREGARTLAARARTRYVMAFSVAVLHANAGEKNEAIEWLDRALREHSGLLESIRMTPEFESLRPDPRFQDVLRRLNLGDDQLARGPG